MTTKYKAPLKKFIDDYWKENCRPPTIREMADALGGISTSIVNYSLEHDLGMTNPNKGDSRWVVPAWIRKAITEYKGDANDNTQTIGE